METPRDAGNWAQPVEELHVGPVQEGGINLNVEGRRVSGPLQGFGQLWQKTYRTPLRGLEMTPEQVVEVWRNEFRDFWPPKNHMYAPLAGIKPGEVGLINRTVGGLRLSTGVLVIYADDTSWSFMTPEGHPFSGFITFSAFVEDGVTYSQNEVLIRASNPITELGMIFGGHGSEDRMWIATHRNLAARLGVPDAAVEKKVVCVDKRRMWRHWRNVTRDAHMTSALHQLTHPFQRPKDPRTSPPTDGSA